MATAALGGGVAAQDIEMTSQVTGQSLPQVYFQRVATQPNFFEIERGGTLPMVVILALFADSPDPIFSQADVQRALFDGPASNGTLTEFYAEASGGRFAVQGQALPWVRTQITLAETVGDNFGLGGTQTGTYLAMALELADPTTDFGRFDNDGPDGVPNSGDDDGMADAVAFQFIEVAASCSGPGIWPHRSTLANWNEAPYETNDLRPDGTPVVVNDYIVQSTVTCDGLEIQTAATIAHELGHVLGLPDLYDSTEGLLPERRRWVVGCWALMAAGAWGCGTSPDRVVLRPPHFGAWEKLQLGWLDLELVGDVRNAEFEMLPVRTTGHVLQIPLSSTEYLLLEYRDGQGFDQDLPAAGVLVYHVDSNRLRRPCRSCERIYHVQLLEADGNDGLRLELLNGGNRGEAGDVFGRQATRLTNSTIPSTRLNSGASSPVAIYAIALDEDRARVRLSTTTISLTQLIAPVLGDPGALSTEDIEYLDSIGNGNGRYDLGDLRRYLLDHSSVWAGAGETARP
jgi:M6 family metalloprotease-like protein